MDVNFFVQMDEGFGVPEFYLDEASGGRHDIEVGLVRESLQIMLQQLQYFAASTKGTEYDLSLVEQDLVFWELESEDDGYESTTAERISETIAEVEYQLENLAVLEVAQLDHVRQVVLVNWKVEGF